MDFWGFVWHWFWFYVPFPSPQKVLQLIAYEVFWEMKMDCSQLVLTSFYKTDNFQVGSSTALVYAAGLVQSDFISMRSFRNLKHQMSVHRL